MTQTFLFHPILDFSSIRNELCDCVITIGDLEIHAHRAVLSNFSDFFYNNFSYAFQESITSHVNIDWNPDGLMPSVIEFMYTCQLEITKDNIMPLLDISIFYGIKSLERNICEMLDTIDDVDVIYELVDTCYDKKLSSALNKLSATVLLRVFDRLVMSVFTEKVDTMTFCNVLEKRLALEPPLGKDDVLMKIKEFVGSAELSSKEKEKLT